MRGKIIAAVLVALSIALSTSARGSRQDQREDKPGRATAVTTRLVSFSATLPAPAVATVTTYALAGQNCPAGACAVVTWQAVTGAARYSYDLYLVGPNNSLTLVSSGTTTATTASFTGLTADSLYGFRIASQGFGFSSGPFSPLYQVNPETCAIPQPYGPANDVVARTAIWDGQSWAAWVSANTPGEFVNTMKWMSCERDSQSDLEASEYVNAMNFGAATGNGTPVWHLAAP